MSTRATGRRIGAAPGSVIASGPIAVATVTGAGSTRTHTVALLSMAGEWCHHVFTGPRASIQVAALITAALCRQRRLKGTGRWTCEHAAPGRDYCQACERERSAGRRERIARLYVAGASIPAIAGAIGTTPDVINVELHGLRKRGRVGYRRARSTSLLNATDRA